MNRQISPRKKPTQVRAKQTIDRIHKATLHLLVTDGLEHLSTKRIAKQAGLSPGSLYQYYPNKQAILFAIYKDWLDFYATMIKDYFDRREEYSTARDWISDTINSVYKHILESSKDERKIDIELTGVMKLYPELRELGAKQDELLTRYFIDVARHFGSKWQDERLQQLCSYANQLFLSFEDICCRIDENLEESLIWHASAVSSVIEICLPDAVDK